ncbi:MAG: radical SAM protein [Thermoplasmata archaeon]|nr:MAG: radical SAM protein [Thermoplasmata archaeon]
MAKSINGGEPLNKIQEGNVAQRDFTEGENLLEKSKSVCPECLEIVDCQIFFRDEKVYMKKFCQEHGYFETLIYSDASNSLAADKFNKPGATPLHFQGSVSKGCPYDCGLCEDHKQHTCVGVIEITEKCNLNCPVCFVDSNNSFSLSFEKVAEMIDLYVRCEGEPEVLQISGGEPTLHPDIMEILKYAGQMGIKYPMLNTNGIKLADRDFARKISETMKNEPYIKKPLIYLQFDGFSDETYMALRGRPLLDIKQKALKNCMEFGMNVTLVPTIVRGINEHEIGKVIDLALNDNNIKMVNFQPSTLTGRYELDDKGNRRLTIPEILDEIEAQSAGLLAKKSFINIPCPYPTCSVCTYVYKMEDRILSLTELFEIEKYMDHIVNRTIPDDGLLTPVNEALDSLLSMSAVMGSEKTESAICTSCGIAIPNIPELMDNITLISVHAFMDEFNFDLKRAKKCCVTEILPNGQMIPFCVYNVLYRKDLKPVFGRMC